MEIGAAKPSVLTISDSDGNQTRSVGEIPEQAREKSITLDSAKEYLSKMGGTPFYLSDLTGIVEEQLSLPAKTLNAMRRNCIEQLVEIRNKIHEVNFIDYTSDLPPALPVCLQKLRLRVETVEQLAGVDISASESVLPLREVLKQGSISEHVKIIVELPRVSF